MFVVLVLLAVGCSDPAPAGGGTTRPAAPVTAPAEPAPQAQATTEQAAPAPKTEAAAATAAETPASLVGRSKAELRLARNTVFARHGRAFSSEDLQQHFGAQDWYQVDPSYSDDMLSDAERAQVALIQSFETDAHTPEDGYEFEGEPGLYFVGPKHVVFGGFTAMYEGTGEERQYAAYGDWVVTWSGDAPLAASSPDLQLRQLDYGDNRVVQVIDHPALQL